MGNGFKGPMNFLLKRVLTYLVVLFVVINITFFLPRFAPGNAAQIIAGGSRLPNVAVQLLTQRFGLDQPLYVQYVDYLKDVFLTWPPYFGVSYNYFPAQVTSIFADRVGWSLLLLLTSLAVGELVTYLMGVYSALRRGGKFEMGSLYGSIAVNSLPLFWVAMIVLYVFSILLGWFPISGATGFHSGGGLAYVGDVIWHAVLPVATLSLSLIAESYLILRGSIQETLQSDYVLAAKARGLTSWMLSSRYVLRNSLLPLVAVISFSIASLISREVLIEVIYGYPGIGDLIVDAILGRDYPVLQGALFYTTIFVIIGGLIGDIVLTRLDPRLRE
jgi:peptide/nickel transport system permease protein